MKNFVESYPLDIEGINPDTDLAHAVQKDAIQNSLDAIDKDNPKDFTVEFKIDKITSPDYLTVTDTGTTGLTGHPSLSRSQLERLTTDQYRKEKWSRMQALGYSHPELGSEIGARGQGKFIFIGSSENNEMIFDTLRADEVYRVGHWETEKNKPLMSPKEGNEAKEYIEGFGFSPLDNIGTRIIIPQPKSEVWRAFLFPLSDDGCDMERYISSTWWEALRNGRSIIIKVEESGIEKEVEPPKIYQQFKNDPDFFEHLRRTSTGKPCQENFPGCIVEELVIAYSEKELPDELKGIALQRGEMTVERFDPTHGNPHLARHDVFRNHIFGWLIMNREGDRELKKTERSCHYHFNQKRGTLALELFGRNGWLSRMVEEFARQMGYAAGGREIAGADRTLTFVNQVMREVFGFTEPTRLGGKSKKEEATKYEKRRRRIIRPQIKLEYPTKGSRRVEFGEKVSNIRVRVANYSDLPMKYKLRMTLNRKKGLRIEDEKEKLLLVNRDGEIPPSDKTEWSDKQTIHFDEEDYKEGKYVISAVSQTPEGKLKREARKLIYLNVDPPPGGGILKEITADTLEPPENRLQYKKIIGEDKKLTVILNDIHPLYELNAKGRSKEPSEDYQIECALNAILDYDFESEGKVVDRKDWNLIRDLMEKYEQFSSTIGETSKARQEFLFDVFKRK
ncbi:hypothetical protein AKJ45_00910 [candidate division MSBL1 archaeon SCGC-AAA261F19]|nr:hypothetical protein AKJ45_00910 [candidate division MSBL1 archaeon SCGC-AAA261F19]